MRRRNKWNSSFSLLLLCFVSVRYVHLQAGGRGWGPREKKKKGLHESIVGAHTCMYVFLSNVFNWNVCFTLFFFLKTFSSLFPPVAFSFFSPCYYF
ncbi:hypothetical protein TRSC58_07218 [Trypanosoma rangeli SC58]|uniref:Secreted protein n=1 Tax=Trypanosoma rangeli SC58 TaxID=429131 RepID=A0A061IRS1_TRYRA|nr:hypothetical protein TRSC58_07218 [Trypanosoma rangeli SC58]